MSEEALTDLLTELRSRVRTKMTRRGKRKFKKEKSGEQNTTAVSQQDNLVLLHSGILGLCSFIEGGTEIRGNKLSTFFLAFPHDVPEFVPPILMELSTHLNDPQVSLLKE